MDRRAIFRDYMRRLDPTGDPAKAVESGFYVPPPNAVSRRIATRLELEPSSSHLLVGGIGSGKTTELIAVERQLAGIEDLLPIRVDVPSRHRLDKLKPGVLIALAAMEGSAALRRERESGLSVGVEIDKALATVSTIAGGYWRDIDPDDYYPEDGDGIWVPGLIEEPQLLENIQQLSDALKVINSSLPEKLVMLFDGLDRIADLAVLASVLSQDIPAIRAAGVGVVLIGPQHLRFSPQRFVESSFETAHLHGAVAAETPEGETFLTSVIRARADEELLPSDSAAAVARWSGGVLRDLVAIARAAGAEAYAAGSESIQISHIDVAADRFGRDLILGSTKEMLARLKELFPSRPRRPGAGAPKPASASLTIATEQDQRLLMERLIIEIPGTPVHYIVHPTIVPLIPGLG